MRNTIILCILMLIVAACTGPMPTNEAETTEQVTDSQQSEDDLETAQETTESVTESQDDESTADFLEMQSLFDTPAQEYMVTYPIESEAGVVTTTMYVKGDLTSADYKMRSDSTINGIESRAYMTNEKITSCSQTNGAWTCFEIETEPLIPTAEYDTDYDETFQTEVEAGNYRVYKDGEVTVSGTTAPCFTAEYDDTTQKMCIHKGVLLYAQTTVNGVTNTLEATDFSLSVDDSVFDLPQGADVMNIDADLENMMGDFDMGDFQ